MESAGPSWSEMENHEAFEQRRLSASECDSVKGREGLLRSMPCRKWRNGLGSVLEGGLECESSK